MAHGAAKTKEPIREGLIAMLGPFLDTNIVCTMTALVIMSTGALHGQLDSDAAHESLSAQIDRETKLNADAAGDPGDDSAERLAVRHYLV